VSAGVSIVLCCATEDEPTLGQLIAVLNGEGLRARVLAGIDEEPRMLGAVMDADKSATVYVVFETRVLDRGLVRQIEGVFSARRGPSDQLVVRRSDGRQRPLLFDIRGAADRALLGVAPMSPRDSGSGMRDVVGVTQVSAFSRPPTSSPHSLSDPERARGRRSRRPSNGSEVVAPEGVEARRRPLAGEGEARKVQWTGAWIVRAAGSALVVLALASIVYLSRGRPESTPSLYLDDEFRARSSSASRIVKAGITTAPAREAVTKPVSAERLPVAREAMNEAVLLIDSTSTSTSTDPGRSSSPQDPDSGEVLKAVARAIRLGRLHALDDLLYIDIDPQETTWAEAVNRCRARRYFGVQGFRVATVGELKKLRRARRLGPGRYWSTTLASTSGEPRRHVLVIDRSVGRARSVSRREHARRICVRLRR